MTFIPSVGNALGPIVVCFALAALLALVLTPLVRTIVLRYGMVDRPEEWRRFYGDRPGWVFTHRDLPLIPGVDITLAKGDVVRAYAGMTERLSGTNLWLVGGGDLVGQFHDARLLDEIILGMAPVTLGRGAPLLPRRITSKELAFDKAELVGQRIRIVVSVRHLGEA